MKVLRMVFSVIGVLLALMGIVWFLQGVNVLPGSMMSGKMQWAINGSIAFLVGIFLFLGMRMTRPRDKKCMSEPC